MQRAFWPALVALIVAKLLLVSDLSVQINFSPHDDSLYVWRAYNLLLGQGYGPYDSTTLLKYPGISLWLAGARELGIPFLISVNAAYIAAGLYLACGLLRAGVGRGVVLATFALYVFNPITLGMEWIRVIREPLGTAMFAGLLAAMLHTLVSLERGRRPWPHLLAFSAVFAFSVYLREDDRLLWAMLPLFAAAIAWRSWAPATRRRALAWALAVVLAPAAVAKAYEYGLRAFAERHYGVPILHDLSEGEFPRLMAAIRSIESNKQNRKVMVTQDALAQLRVQVPEFRPVIDRLPPPGRETFSCRLQGVCSEWSNGWMPFWIRDAAWSAGLTPSLPQGQEYYRLVRTRIEEACAAGRLRCAPDGTSLLPPMHLRWTRALVVEAWRLLKQGLAPDPHVVGAPPQVYNVSPEIAKTFQETTLTRSAATEWKAAPGEESAPPSARGTLRAWIVALLRPLGALVLLGGLAALGMRLWRWNAGERGAFETAALLLVLYCGLRFAALSYVAVYMGGFDPRMMFSAYTAGLAFAVPLIAAEIRHRRGVR